VLKNKKGTIIMKKYLIVILPLLLSGNVSAEIENEIGANHPLVNTATMQSARYICHAFVALTAQNADVQKVPNLHQKLARLSAHCAKGQFATFLTESGLSDSVHLKSHPSFTISHHVMDGGDPSTYTPSSNHRKINSWEHRSILVHQMAEQTK
jgi:hypothetical protein